MTRNWQVCPGMCNLCHHSVVFPRRNAKHQLLMWLSIQVTEAKLGDENKFYYDNELKQWRVQGEEAPPPSGPPPPPPKMTPQRSASGSLAAGIDGTKHIIVSNESP